MGSRSERHLDWEGCYRPHLDRFPERSAAALSAIAGAEPGGVVFHCGGGRDRAGQIAMLVLALAGVSADDVAADYALSAEGIIVDILGSFDVEAHLRAGGLTNDDVVALRSRLVCP